MRCWRDVRVAETELGESACRRDRARSLPWEPEPGSRLIGSDGTDEGYLRAGVCLAFVPVFAGCGPFQVLVLNGESWLVA